MSDQIDVNYLADALNNKMDLPAGKNQGQVDYVVEWKTPTSSDPYWYRKYKSGWIEQGCSPTFSSWTLQTVTLLFPYKDDNYVIHFGGLSTRSSSTDVKGMVCEVKTSTYFKFYAGGSDWVRKDWRAAGQGA